MPIEYDEPVFRPPSEAYSLILQVTLGCSWNKCAFCEMYSTKKFRARSEKDILAEIDKIAKIDSNVRKVFLADGNATVLATAKLLKILEALNSAFPKLRRISAYALPNDLESKSAAELTELHDAGLKLVYVGIESGDDDVLKYVCKSETAKSTVAGLCKAQQAGIQTSVMIINGLGGKKFSQQHAVNSAKILNEIQPTYASTLVLSFPFGVEVYQEKFLDEYVPMSQIELLEEMQVFISHTELKNTVFRSDHASNYLVLRGNLGRDKDKMLKNIELAIQNPDNLRQEWQRGL